jgi:hypothetical protein
VAAQLVPGDGFVVRVAGLPASALDALRFGETYRLVSEVIDSRSALGADGAAFSAELHDLIGTLAGDPGRGALIALRRSLYQVKPIEGALTVCAAALPADLADRLRAWSRRERRLALHIRQLPGVLSAETAAQTAALRSVVALPQFTTGLAHSSPALAAELSKWLDGGSAPKRQTVLRLATYVARCAAKTSPYSTFTTSGMGTWSGTAPLRLRSFAEQAMTTDLDLGTVAQIGRLLTRHPALVGKLPVRLNSSAIVDDDSVAVLGPPPHEALVRVPLTPAVRRCLQALSTGVTSTRSQLCAELAAAAGDADADRVPAYVGRLIDIGIIESGAPVPDQSADPLGDLLRWIDGAAAMDATLRNVRDKLGRLRTELAARAHAGNAAGPDAVARLLAAVLHDLGEPAPSAAGDGEHSFARRHTLYDNVVHPRVIATADKSAWQEVFTDLDAVRRLAALFDPDLAEKLAVQAYFHERYPRGEPLPLMRFYADTLAELAAESPSGPAAAELARLHGRGGLVDSRATPGALRASAVGSIAELGRLRLAARAAINSRPIDPDGVLRLTGPEAAAIGSAAGGWLQPPASIAVYGQVAQDVLGPRLVINEIHSGFGRGRSRVLRSMRQAGAAPRLGQLAGAGVVYVECDSAHGSALNQREPVLPVAIDYPYSVSTRAQAERIPIRDLFVDPHPGTGALRLTSSRLDGELHPVHTGLGADWLIPPALRFLLRAFGTAPTLVAGGMSLRSDLQEFTALTGVRHTPRLDIGRVTLRRAHWAMRAGDFPGRHRGEEDARWFLRVHEWLAEHQMPARCFTQIIALDIGDRIDLVASTTARKPAYLDFASWFQLAAFGRRLRDPDAILILHEADPAPGAAIAADGGERHVTEYIFELNDREAFGA